MPPKKQAKAAPGQTAFAADEDLSDVSTLPMLNEFNFITLYSFKYKKNMYDLDQALYKKIFVPAEGETAE